jgi:ankyrin repeat protein
MSGGDPTKALRPLIQIGNMAMIEPMLEKIDLLKYGADLLQIACVEGKRDIVEMLIKRGVDIMAPPEKVTGDDQYRKSPFVIEAVKSGDMDTLECVVKNGGSLTELGAICLSKKRKNVVISNLVGCAAYHGKKVILKVLANRLGKNFLNFEAIEQNDSYSDDKKFKKEFAGYTPLMLTVAKGDECLDCLQILLQNDADYRVKDEEGNNLLHIAA